MVGAARQSQIVTGLGLEKVTVSARAERGGTQPQASAVASVTISSTRRASQAISRLLTSVARFEPVYADRWPLPCANTRSFVSSDTQNVTRRTAVRVSRDQAHVHQCRARKASTVS